MDAIRATVDVETHVNPYLEIAKRKRAETMPENLKDRYDQLVAEHLSPAQKLSAGLRALPGENEAFASTQAAWRFFANENTTLQQIFQPVLAHVSEQVSADCEQHVLVACDWCNLHYKNHKSKEGRVALANNQDLGYETFNGLALSDKGGQPIGPLWIELRDALGVHSTHDHFVRQPLSVLDEVIGNMEFVTRLKLPKTPVFIIDAESDSIAHLRLWSAKGKKFLVRGKASHTAMHQGTKRSLSKIGDELKQSGQFEFAREVEFEGRLVQQWVAETPIVITRPARPERKGQPRKNIPGPPLELRLVVSELRDDEEKVVAIWYLQTNLDAAVDKVIIVLWYYWRWRVESYHKLLKSDGQHIESWRQESGEAIARRLAIASMACVIVWRIQRDPSEEGARVRKLLIRLSGRQMSRKRPATAPALLAGFWVLLATLDVLQSYDIEFLQECAQYAKEILASKSV